MGDGPAESTIESDATDTREIRTEIESELLDQADELYPAATSTSELVRRVFERGVLAREGDLRERGGGDE